MSLMDDVKTILGSGKATSEIIDSLKQKSVDVPDWDLLVKDYDPELHKINTDATRKRNGMARIYVGIEQMLTKRMQEFMFAIPSRRIYHNIEDNQARQDIADAIEAVYKYARVATENVKRSREYFAACEFFTLWYLTENENDLYGFHSKYKLKCRTFAPMDGTHLWPLFDETGDLVAMSYEYKKKVGSETVTFFETYTADHKYKWKNKGGDWEEMVEDSAPISILKIPGVYMYRQLPIYHGLSHMRENLEYTLSRSSDIVEYNAAPVLKLAGEVIPEPYDESASLDPARNLEEEKNDPIKVFRVENGGDVQFVSWAQGLEATKWHVDYLWGLIHKLAQLPDVSAETMAALGNIGYDARQTLLMDAHLKVGDESGPWIETFERETNVIKAYLKQMNTAWSAADIDAVEVEHVIEPFILNDEAAEIDKWVKATGGKPIISQLTGIKNAGLAANADDELNQIQQEDTASQMSAMAGVFESAQ